MMKGTLLFKSCYTTSNIYDNNHNTTITTTTNKNSKSYLSISSGLVS